MTQAHRQRRGFVRWLFEDRSTGRIVVGQWPNLPLLIFVGASATRLLLKPRDGLGDVIDVVETGSLAVWAMDEAVSGVNPFRRIGGMIVLAAGPLASLLR